MNSVYLWIFSILTKWRMMIEKASSQGKMAKFFLGKCYFLSGTAKFQL